MGQFIYRKILYYIGLFYHTHWLIYPNSFNHRSNLVLYDRFLKFKMAILYSQMHKVEFDIFNYDSIILKRMEEEYAWFY